MIDINTIKVGNLVNVLLQGEYKLKKGGRNGVELNKYYGRVTRDFRFAIRIADENTYNNMYPDAAGKPTWFEFIKDGLVRHKTNGNLYIAGTPVDNRKTNRFDILLDGRPITTEELQYIKKYRDSGDELKFITAAIDNCSNVEE